MKNILVIGSEGYIGHYIVNYFESLGWNVHCTGKSSSKRANYYSVDIEDKEVVSRVIHDLKPEVVFHVAGISSLAVCEKEPERSRAVNEGGTSNIVEAVKSLESPCKLIFLSSDYVFDGDSGNYKEDSERKPKTVYGQSKVVSEDDIMASLSDYIILRMSNVYGHGGNFYNFVSSTLAANKSVELFNDTYYSPVCIDYLTRALQSLVEKDYKGVLHIGGPNRLSRYDFGLLVAEHLNADESLITGSVQPEGGLISNDSSLCTDKAAGLLALYNPPVIKALHIISGIFTYPHIHFADDRGVLHGVTQGRDWEEVNFVESAADTVRGNHYHRKTVEGFYIISGKLKINFKWLVGKKNYWFYAEAGDSFLIQPKINHTFEVLEPASWINYLSRAMYDDEEKDIHRE